MGSWLERLGQLKQVVPTDGAPAVRMQKIEFSKSSLCFSCEDRESWAGERGGSNVAGVEEIFQRHLQ